MKILYRGVFVKMFLCSFWPSFFTLGDFSGVEYKFECFTLKRHTRKTALFESSRVKLRSSI